MRRWLALAGCLMAACRGGSDDAAGDAPADTADEAPRVAVVPDTTLPEMPPVPARREGRLTAVAVGSLKWEEAWPARAGRCAQPAMILLIAEHPGRSGASVLLELPESGELTGEYPVRLADSAGVPEPPAAQLGFQFFDDRTADAFQGAEGVVRVTALDDLRLSGEFQVTVRHITTEHRARIAGAFHQVDVEPLAPDWCERAQAAQDSLVGTQ